ncbi:MAG: glycoside hydrolase [Betaproteobacteria bacterium]|nr:glycoside hydrolase [Betaproteobacteria bacterium]
MEGKPLDLVFLWHMHQPDYRDQVSGEYHQPWAYLHALKDYTDMVAHLERHPGVRAVVNFVPVLIEQIEDYVSQFATGQFRDPLLRVLASDSLDGLDEASRRWLIATCFPDNHARMVAPFPRFQRLHEVSRIVLAQGEVGLRYLSGSFFADLVTWYHLVWTGETERRRQSLLAELMSRGENFSCADRRQLLALIGATLAELLPRYRALAERGQIELSTTPGTHPLAPLLIDLQSAREALPELNLPRAPIYPGGAQRVAAQIKQAFAQHQRCFGQDPTGLWPAEGALSNAFLKEIAAAGFRWTASSETVLKHSLRETDGTLRARAEFLYRPWVVGVAPGLAVFFRDERLSDLIGFEYARWHGRDAAAHFLEGLRRIRAEVPAEGRAVVTVALDGENAWEHYPYNGYYFFEDLYSVLEAAPDLRCTTFTTYLNQGLDGGGVLPTLTAGSWVYGNFSTWIGDEAKNRAWDLLCVAKQAYDLVLASGRLDAAARAKAEAQLAVCEGSDWFWWFGDYNPQEAVRSFDTLFRANLGQLYQLLHLPLPEELITPIAQGRGTPEGGGSMRRAN